MDITGFVRDPKQIKSVLKTLPDDSLVATKRVYIYIPVRFEERGLASIGAETYIACIYAIATENGFYGVSTTNAMMRIEPSNVNTVKVGNEAYYEFIFEAGSTVCPNLNLVRDDVLTYRIFDEFFAKGKVPWYLGYDDLGSIYDSAEKHANVGFGNNKVVIELITSIIARDPSNRYEMYRHIIKDRQTLLKTPPEFIPLDAIQFTATNTTAKLVGAYMSDGIVSALVNPSERVERIESLLTN